MIPIEALVEDVLHTIPEGLPLAVVMDALNFVLAATIIHAGNGDIAQEELILQVCQRDLATKVNGAVN
jgi:hypothetical protein